MRCLRNTRFGVPLSFLKPCSALEYERDLYEASIEPEGFSMDDEKLLDHVRSRYRHLVSTFVGKTYLLENMKTNLDIPECALEFTKIRVDAERFSGYDSLLEDDYNPNSPEARKRVATKVAAAKKAAHVVAAKKEERSIFAAAKKQLSCCDDEESDEEFEFEY